MRGVITFVFDDGYERVYHNVLPLLREYKIPAVFALCIDAHTLEKAEHRAIKPWQQWADIVKEGHEIASHSVTHPNLTKVSDEKLDTELRESAQKLGASTLVYPGGAVDERVAVAASRFYTAGRTVHYGFEHVPPQDCMRLKSYNFSKKNFSVARVNLLALWALISNSWLIETYHMVDGNDSKMLHSVMTDALEKHLSFVSRLPIETKTIREVITGDI